MLPGKKYNVDDFVRIAWKRKWLILAPAMLIAAATFTWSYYLPNRYRSQTTVLVIPQRVPESYVRSTVTAGVAERLTTITQQILSRTRLERIIDEFNLYQQERQIVIMEDIVGQMRRDVKIDVPKPRRRHEDTSSFTVGFEAAEPRTAMLVAERLASLFVQENLQDREVLADSTNQFLQAQLEDARRRLIEHEKKLEEFRRRNMGRLPTQAQSNIQILQTTQTRLQANADGTAKDRDRLMALESALADAANAPQATLGAPPTNAKAGKDSPPVTAARQLEAEKANLRNLELRLKPEHPDVIRARRLIAELELKAEREALAAAVSPESAPVALTRGQGGAKDRLTEMRMEVQEIRSRLEARKQEDARLQQALASYTTRLEAAPTLESEQTELMRDYSTLHEQYTTLLRKSEESKIAVNLERRQIGEQFRVMDSARMPERPASPNRVRINLMGLFGGLAFGLALAALLEYRDTTLKTDDDIVISLSLPVLAVIPAMVTTGERRRIRHRRLLLAISGSVASVLAVATLVAWRLQLLQAWVR